MLLEFPIFVIVIVVLICLAYLECPIDTTQKVMTLHDMVDMTQHNTKRHKKAQKRVKHGIPKVSPNKRPPLGDPFEKRVKRAFVPVSSLFH